MNDLEVECIVHGKVQGVTYRAYAKKRADELGLFGYVENMEDGSVEIMAQGERDKLEDFIELIKKGPYFARVDEVEVEWHETLQDSYSDFTIR